MAGTIPGFPAQAVRDGLRIPMRMGMPVDVNQWPEFVITSAPVPDPATDDRGYPWDPDAPAPPPAETRVRVLCAFEVPDPAQRQENFGAVQPATLIVTLLDEEYLQVEGFEYVNIWLTAGGGPTRYYYRNVHMRSALDTVEVWQIEVATEDVT